MYTGFSMGVGIVYLTALYMLLPLYSALEKLPKSYTEVAADLGAGAWVRFRKITSYIRRNFIWLYLSISDFYGILCNSSVTGRTFNYSICGDDCRFFTMQVMNGLQEARFCCYNVFDSTYNYILILQTNESS